VQAHPKKFLFVENSGKIPENLGKNCGKRCLISKNGAQRSQNTHEDLFYGEHTKRRVFMIFAG